MFIISKLFYGEAAPESEEKDVSGEQLKTQVVDDWVVVDPCGDGHRDVPEEVQEVSVATAPTQPVRTEQAGGDLVVQTRNRLVHAMLSPGLATPEQLVRKMRCAQRSQCCKTQKNISNHRCDMQNKVYEHLGQSKANNRRNKRSRPSGFKSSRVNQRM